MTTSDQINELTGQILEAVPKRCEGCIKPEVYSSSLALSVFKGYITLEQAKEDIQTDIDQNCQFGLAEDDLVRRIGGRCMYGIYCSLIPPEPLNPDHGIVRRTML